MLAPRAQLADALKQARIAAGFTAHGPLAKKLVVSRSLISRAENPREAVPSDSLIVRWAQETHTEPAKLLEYAARARNPQTRFTTWSDDYEQRATLLRWFEALLVPGLVQTPDYMRAVASWKPFVASVDATISDRLARQSVLDRAEYRALILESVLDRTVGNAEVMAEQLGHLLVTGERPNVTLQIVPDVPDIAGALAGAFGIATEGAADTAAYSGSLIDGSVHTDSDRIARAVTMFDHLHANALPWSHTRDSLQERIQRWRAQA